MSVGKMLNLANAMICCLNAGVVAVEFLANERFNWLAAVAANATAFAFVFGERAARWGDDRLSAPFARPESLEEEDHPMMRVYGPSAGEQFRAHMQTDDKITVRGMGNGTLGIYCGERWLFGVHGPDDIERLGRMFVAAAEEVRQRARES